MFHNHHLLGNDHIDVETSMMDLCNIDEWSAASGMLAEKGIFDTPRTSAQDHNSKSYVYNPGDIEADF